jgi:ankyrin repeat protein
MSGDPPPHQQHIGQVFAQDGSQAFAGSFNNCQFSNDDSQSSSDELFLFPPLLTVVNKWHSIEAFERAASACRSALFLTDPCVERESLISRKGTRAAGTCEWITHNESYQSWLDGSTRLLWISGGPGKGKTMLSIFLTEQLEASAPNAGNTQLVYYFCSHQDEMRNTAVAVLRGLVHQIVTKRPRLIKHALPYFETPERTQQTLSSLETVWIIFSKMVNDPDLEPMFCVLDGLDECDEDTLRVLVPKIVGVLSSKASSSTTKAFKLVIVSRDISSLQGCARVKLDPDNNKKVARDIERFISVRVDELSRIEGFNDKFRTTVQTTLLARAEGTFLWVGFVMNELLQKKTCSQVLEALYSFPRGLPAVYSRMLLQIPSQHRRISSTILRWVTMAFRPLLLQELAAAVGVQSSSPPMTLERAIRDEIALCGPFLKVQEQEVSLVHQSARDYLLRKERDSNAVLEEFRIEPEKAHLELARTCLERIVHSGLQHAPLNLDNEPCSQESLLLQYAVLHWPEHARCCSELAAELFSPSEAFFQTDSALREHWWSAYRKAARLYLPSSLPLLHLACYLGVVPWVEAILTKRSWMPSFHKPVDKKDGNGETALHKAASRGHEAVIRALVYSGANVNAKNEDGWTALHRAAMGGHEAVVRLLVDSGADARAKDKSGQTVLHSAAWGGNEAVVRLLVDNGADARAKDESGQMVLHSAAWGGNEAVVRVLVESGANVEARDADRKTALHSAAWKGNEAVVRVLIDSGADVKAKNEDGQTALHLAAWRGHEAVVQLLVDSGADVKAKNKGGETVLYSAAWRGNEAVIRTLVYSGANVNAKNKHGKTALHSAAWRGNEAAVRLLVDSGADVKAKNEDGQTALHLAAWRGYEAVVRLLVDSGADVKAKNDYGQTALHRAALGENDSVVRLLEATLAS